VKRILVLRLSALGDVIHTIPAVAALREEADVSWVVEAPYREIVEIVAGVSAIPVRMKQWARSPRAIFDARRAMRGADVSIDFQGLIKSAMLGILAGAKERIGFAHDAIREKPALLFTNRKITVDTTKHVIEQNLQLIGRETGREGDWESYAPTLPKTRDILILPGAGKPSKLWPVERWRELAKKLGDDVVVAWGPGERERAERVGARLSPPTSVRELASLMRGARLVVGGDTGPLHLAAALGTKVVGLYGPTNPRRNGPYGQLDHCIDEFTRSKCMDAITVEAVMNLVERVSAE
jgi:lipopolysaccharide heptosyltransferase I